jgi:PPE-repeat protein
MYGYAASSAAAGKLTPLTEPSRLTDPAGIANQAAAVGQAAASGSAQQAGLSNLISNGPNAVQSLASPVTSTAGAAGLDTVIHEIDGLLGTPLVHSALTHTMSGTVADHGVTFASGNTGDDDTEVAASGAAPRASAALAAGATPAGVGATPIVAGLGNASSVGRLSVPAGWSTAAPAMTAGAPVDGTGWAVPEEDGEVAAMPPAPGLVVAAGDAGAGAGPRYGVRPTVMPKQGLF